MIVEWQIRRYSSLPLFSEVHELSMIIVVTTEIELQEQERSVEHVIAA